MELTASDLRTAHERLGRPEELLHQRRTLYATAIELCGDVDHADVHVDVLDNPAVRGHLGAVLSGRAEYSIGSLCPLGELVASGFATELADWPVRLASTVAASAALAGALGRIAGELELHGDRSGTLELITLHRAGDLEEAYAHLVDGVGLAGRVAPELALDLLPHVGLFGVVAQDESSRLGSASTRDYPGLILIPTPRTALGVAEALIHEGAHQKFFDLGMTRAVLGNLAPEARRFSPSWAPPGAPGWPLEQAMAAWHAYHCLAAFARSLDKYDNNLPLHGDSLLPNATHRANEIGRWLHHQGVFLGPDAHALIGELEGVRPSDPWPSDEYDLQLGEGVDSGELVLRRAGSRTLVARLGTPPDLYWVDAALTQEVSG